CDHPAEATHPVAAKRDTESPRPPTTLSRTGMGCANSFGATVMARWALCLVRAVGGWGLGGGVGCCGSAGFSDVSLSDVSLEELIREPGESGSPTGRLEAARLIVEGVAEGAWATTKGATA